MMGILSLRLILYTLIIINNTKCCAADITGKTKDGSLNRAAASEGNTACTRRSNSQMHEIKTAAPNQFPFIASIMSHQNEHLCTGTVVSNGMVLTSARCTQLPVSYVLLNTTKAKKDTSVALRIIKTKMFPTFTGTQDDKDVGLIYTEKNNIISPKIKLSDFTSGRKVVDMEVIGFGLNAEMGQTKELQYIGAENRMPMRTTDVKEELTAYIDCIDTKVPTCFRDKGGPSISSNELVGIVTNGEDKCVKEINSTYSVNKKVADILPGYIFKAWLDELIQKNEQDLYTLVSYPIHLRIKRDTGAAAGAKSSNGDVIKFSFALLCASILIFV